MIHVPACSLVALRLAKAEQFYAQDWYLAEPFARAPVAAGWYDPWRVPAPAAVAVWAALETLRQGELPGTRTPTTDHDEAGHPVYVGYGAKGIEVHRYLEAAACA